MTEKKKTPDWELIERDFRAGIRSLRQIAGDHGITETAIRKRAKRDSWPRDLEAKIKAKADDLVRKAAVRREVRPDTPCELEIVEANAKLRAMTTIRQQQSMEKYAKVVDALMDRLGLVVAERDQFEAAVRLMVEGNPKGAEALEKAISMPVMASTMDRLAAAAVKLFTFERTVLGIKDDEGGKARDTVDDLLDRLNRMDGAMA